jgi:regulator of sigma D
VNKVKRRPDRLLNSEDIIREVFANKQNSVRIYRSLAKCAPYARFKRRRRTLGAKMLQHMTPMLLDYLNLSIDWEAVGLQVIYKHLANKSKHRVSPYRRRAK